MFYNQYREKIETYPNIWNDEEKIYSKRWQWKAFLKKDKIMLEIGTGMGNFFAHYAENNVDIWCVGIELKFKRLHRTYEKSVEKGRGDVVLLRVMGQKIADIFDSGEVDELYLLFSDPWPKKWHHKNRVIQYDFLESAFQVLSENGIFMIKTDDDMYASWIQEHLYQTKIFEYEVTTDEDPEKRATPENATEFETIWRNQWKKITKFVCRKISPQ